MSARTCGECARLEQWPGFETGQCKLPPIDHPLSQRSGAGYHVALPDDPACVRFLPKAVPTTPCGIVCVGILPVDVCSTCSHDCPSRGHERTCRGGCSECTCGGHE